MFPRLRAGILINERNFAPGWPAPDSSLLAILRAKLSARTMRVRGQRVRYRKGCKTITPSGHGELVCKGARQNEGAGKREIPNKTRRRTASSGTTPTYENPGVTWPGIEPGSPWWEAGRLTAQQPGPPEKLEELRSVIWRITALQNDTKRLQELCTFAQLQNHCTSEWHQTSARGLHIRSVAVSANLLLANRAEVSTSFCRPPPPYLRYDELLSLYTVLIVQIAPDDVMVASPVLQLLPGLKQSTSETTASLRPLWNSRGRGSLLASHQRDPSSFPDRVTPDFRMWESCQTMPLVGGFSRGYPVSPTLSFRRCSILTSITLIGSQDLDVKSHPNLFTFGTAVQLCAKLSNKKFRFVPDLSRINLTVYDTISYGFVELSGEIWVALNIEVFRTDEDEVRRVWSSTGKPGWRKREIPEKTRGPMASPGTIHTVDGATRSREDAVGGVAESSAARSPGSGGGAGVSRVRNSTPASGALENSIYKKLDAGGRPGHMDYSSRMPVTQRRDAPRAAGRRTRPVGLEVCLEPLACRGRNTNKRCGQVGPRDIVKIIEPCHFMVALGHRQRRAQLFSLCSNGSRDLTALSSPYRQQGGLPSSADTSGYVDHIATMVVIKHVFRATVSSCLRTTKNASGQEIPRRLKVACHHAELQQGFRKSAKYLRMVYTNFYNIVHCVTRRCVRSGLTASIGSIKFLSPPYGIIIGSPSERPATSCEQKSSRTQLVARGCLAIDNPRPHCSDGWMTTSPHPPSPLTNCASTKGTGIYFLQAWARERGSGEIGGLKRDGGGAMFRRRPGPALFLARALRGGGGGGGYVRY
ncbi:hypothetical protein PR048_002341 [Dryococelus australis]|uniref:Uncharacterized protein n=1 Tax=Dryococelus australis TaxID=614101 RepID=A0ABQ9ILE8_9NEOP|nr:hypothetical protein PR048_002341 [Dryococelus australis]